MAVHSPIRKLTYEDFERFPEDDRLRHEILDGVHVVSPSPTIRHQRLSKRVFRKLDSFVEAQGLGEIFYAPMDVLLSRHDIVEPDLFFIAGDRDGIVTEKNVQGAPDLVVEILSPGTRKRDLVDKRERYEALGVQEYWVFDPDRHTVAAFRREGEHFGPPLRLSAAADERLTTPLLPGLEIRLRDLFAR
jgi:Uma2 family endonuclease